MGIKLPPKKPFDDFKWRWAVLTPTESLNDPPVFLGVLRVFNKYNHFAPSSDEVINALSIVQSETNSSVDLVRTKERNLIRNSGQYWKALGLIEDAHGEISVTPFGIMLSNGLITQTEFATTIVKTLELPNRNIINDTSEWDKIGLSIKPLELLLNIIAELSSKYGLDNGYITPFELVKIIIPLSGAFAIIDDYLKCIIDYRNNKLELSNWPDCAPNSNDKRMAREYLLFLNNYGFITSIKTEKGNDNEKYVLSSLTYEDFLELKKIKIIKQRNDIAAKELRITQIPANIERKKVSRELLERPYQNIFRKNVLAMFSSKCLITGVTIENVLEAAHIVPVKDKGTDNIDNGLCLRSDIHQLYDSGHLKVLPSGVIHLSELALEKNNYYHLPKQIALPDFINKSNLDWRAKYY